MGGPVGLVLEKGTYPTPSPRLEFLLEPHLPSQVSDSRPCLSAAFRGLDSGAVGGRGQRLPRRAGFGTQES